MRREKTRIHPKDRRHVHGQHPHHSHPQWLGQEIEFPQEGMSAFYYSHMMNTSEVETKEQSTNPFAEFIRKNPARGTKRNPEKQEGVKTTPEIEANEQNKNPFLEFIKKNPARGTRRFTAKDENTKTDESNLTTDHSEAEKTLESEEKEHSTLAGEQGETETKEHLQAKETLAPEQEEEQPTGEEQAKGRAHTGSTPQPVMQTPQAETKSTKEGTDPAKQQSPQTEVSGKDSMPPSSVQPVSPSGQEGATPAVAENVAVPAPTISAESSGAAIRSVAGALPLSMIQGFGQLEAPLNTAIKKDKEGAKGMVPEVQQPLGLEKGSTDRKKITIPPKGTAPTIQVSGEQANTGDQYPGGCTCDS